MSEPRTCPVASFSSMEHRRWAPSNARRARPFAWLLTSALAVVLACVGKKPDGQSCTSDGDCEHSCIVGTCGTYSTLGGSCPLGNFQCKGPYGQEYVSCVDWQGYGPICTLMGCRGSSDCASGSCNQCQTPGGVMVGCCAPAAAPPASTGGGGGSGSGGPGPPQPAGPLQNCPGGQGGTTGACIEVGGPCSPNKPCCSNACDSAGLCCAPSGEPCSEVTNCCGGYCDPSTCTCH